ncbi:helicase MOV-10 [Pelodytes ibericus]
MSNKFNMKEVRLWGEKYLQYLIETGRVNIQNKAELRSIYVEFKQRDDLKKPSFSTAIYGLRSAKKAVVTPETITFNQVVQRRVSLTDQYWAIRRAQNEEPEPEPIPVSSNDIKYTRGEAKKIIRWLKQNKSNFTDHDNTNQILITSDYDLSDGKIRFRLAPNDHKSVPIHIENSSKAPVTFVQYKVLRRMRAFSFTDEQSVSKSNPIILQPGDVYEVTVHCSTTSYGYFPVTLVFEFWKGNDKSKQFLIGRFISAVSSSKLSDDLGPSSRYVPYQKNLIRQTVRNEEDGLQPDSSVQYELERELPLRDYNPPAQLRSRIPAGVFSSPKHQGRFSDQQDRDLLFSTLHFGNYTKKFDLMLYLEEIQMEIDIRKYDKRDQEMMKDPRNNRFLLLDVPGVAECRPSVLRGDHLFVVLSTDRENPAATSYKGYVHGVELEKVKLGFSQNLVQRFINGMKCDVIFTFNRLPLKIQHRAVDLAKERNIEHFLFPTLSFGKTFHTDEKLILFDRSLEENKEQYSAVKEIVRGVSRPAPYLIFGPPGTGKTVTLVEAMKQVLKCIPNTYILACAPSNSASDLLCQRLMKHLDQKDIYRLSASSRDYRAVPEDIKPCCNWDHGRQCYVYPSKDKLMTYRVIITTLITAGRLVSAVFPKNHFSHVFIDEAGHAVEPECVTAIAGLLDVNEGQLVLAGDPKQLGPILRSPLAIEHGLGMSLLERLMTHNPLYQKDDKGYNSKFVTKLLKNYRSHPSILKVPNELFYDNELQASANAIISNSYCNWERLPRRGFPIIFHGVLGKDDREGNSPSFFNVIEIEELMSYLQSLLQTQGKKGLAKISPKEIGIISPYRKQVEKIRKAIDLTNRNVPDIKELKVGSVEEFQGQERRVILISTVRSSEDYVNFDEDFSLGFLKNPKRLNVAITRAKALLILVGNPIILSKDPNWLQFLKYCRDNGGYTGYNIEDDEEMMNDEEFTELFNNLHINRPPAGEETGESFVQQQAEPAWRAEI